MPESQSQSDKSNVQSSEWECSICGRDGGPIPSCPVCRGSVQYRQKKHFTLTEERKGANQERHSSRYSPGGGVGVTIVNLPGSYNPTIDSSKGNE